MKINFYLLALLVCFLFSTACEKDENENLFLAVGREVSFDLTDHRGNYKDIGEVGTRGIDISGNFSNMNGGLSGQVLITCDRAGKYGYQVTIQPHGECNLNTAVQFEGDTTMNFQIDEKLSELTKKEIYYDENVEAGTRRIIYFSQGLISGYEYEIKVRYIEP